MTRFGKFIVNGTILTLVSLLIRGVSVGFNVYVSNKIGAEGIGLYTLITTVYGFALTLATSGINLATTRLVSEALGKKKDALSRDVRCIIGKCVTYALLFSVCTSVILYLSSDYIGVVILRDRRTTSSLRLLAFTLPPISISSALCGYFTAIRKGYDNAIVQVIGQVVKIFSTVVLFSTIFLGDTETACRAMVIGTLLSEIISFGIQCGLYVFERRGEDKSRCDIVYKKGIAKRLMGIALPVAFSTYVRSALITIEHILIPIGLEKSGNDKGAALSSYGTVHSMVFPLVLFSSAMLTSFAGLLVPEVSESRASYDNERINRIVSRVMRAALIFSIGVAGIIGFFAYELGDTIYPNSDAGKYIRMVAPLIPVMYLDSSVDAILKGLGEQIYCMVVNIIDSGLSVILVLFLLPRYGIYGYIMTVYFTELINATLSVTRLLSLSTVKPKIFTWIVKPMFSVIASTLITKFVFSRGLIFTSPKMSLTICIFFSILIYVILLMMTGTVKKSQIKNYYGYIKNGLSR